MNKPIGELLLGAMLIWSLPVLSHTAGSLDSATAPHGGQVRTAGPYRLELVAKDGELLLYVTDGADNKIVTDDGLAKATVQLGKSKTRTRVDLHPSGENTFKGTGEFFLKPETVIVVFIKLPEEEAHAARFTPLKPKTAPAKKGKKKPPATGRRLLPLAPATVPSHVPNGDLRGREGETQSPCVACSHSAARIDA